MLLMLNIFIKKRLMRTFNDKSDLPSGQASKLQSNIGMHCLINRCNTTLRVLYDQLFQMQHSLYDKTILSHDQMLTFKHPRTVQNHTKTLQLLYTHSSEAPDVQKMKAPETLDLGPMRRQQDLFTSVIRSSEFSVPPHKLLTNSWC